MASYEEIQKRLLEYLEPLADPGEKLTADTDLVTALGMDSHKVLDMLLDIEDDFDVAVPTNALADVRTPADLAALIHRLSEEGD